jgi:hypothetical protein
MVTPVVHPPQTQKKKKKKKKKKECRFGRYKKNMKPQTMVPLLIFCCFYFLVRLGFELRASSLQSSHSTA